MTESLLPTELLSSTPSVTHRVRFSIRSLLWLFLAVALAMACLVQTAKLRNAEQALARNEWSGRDVSLPPGKFRLMMNPILDSKNQKVYVWRVEFLGVHYISAKGATSLSTSLSQSFSTPNGDANAQWGEVMLFVNYDEQARRLTTLGRTKSNGTATGISIGELPAGQFSDSYIEILAKPGLYDIGQPIDLYRENGEAVRLIVQ